MEHMGNTNITISFQTMHQYILDRKTPPQGLVYMEVQGKSHVPISHTCHIQSKIDLSLNFVI